MAFQLIAEWRENPPCQDGGRGGRASQLEQKSSGKSKQGVFVEEEEGQCS